MVEKGTILNSKFVGVWLPQQTNSFLSLYALCKGLTKSKLIRDSINSWTEETEREHPSKHLISILITKYQKEWDDKKRLYKLELSNRFNIFKEDLFVYLDRKGLDETDVFQIVEGLIQ